MFDLSKIDAKDAEMPVSRRGRVAQPIPENIVAWVKESYSGSAKSVKVPNGEVNDKGNDTNVVAFTGLLRRAANTLGLGLSVSVKDPTKTTTEVLFKAKDRAERKRRTADEKAQDDFYDFFTQTEPEEIPADLADNENAIIAWNRYLDDGDET